MAPGESSSAPRLLVVLLLGILSNNLVLCLDKKYAGIGSKVKCSAVKVFSPKSVEEVSQAVLDARKQGVTVRAVGKLSTPNDMICTGGYVLDMLAMNKIVVDEKSMVVTAEAGALFEDIYEVLHRMGYSLTASASKFSGEKGSLIFPKGFLMNRWQYENQSLCGACLLLRSSDSWSTGQTCSISPTLPRGFSSSRYQIMPHIFQAFALSSQEDGTLGADFHPGL